MYKVVVSNGTEVLANKHIWNTDDKTIESKLINLKKITIIDSFFLWYYYYYYIQIVVRQIKIENFINNNFFFHLLINLYLFY